MSGDVERLFRIIASRTDFDVERFVLESGIEINSRFGEDDATPLIHAVKNNRVDSVRFLLSRNNTVISAVNKHGQNAAMIAARNGLTNLMSLLLDTGAIDVNHQDNHGMNLFMHACESRKVDVVREVLKYSDIDVSARDNNGITCLMYSIRHFHNKFYDELVWRGADIHARDFSGRGIDAYFMDIKAQEDADEYHGESWW